MKNESTVVERIVTTTDSGTLSRYWIISAMVGLLFSSVTGLLISLERIDLSAANIFSTADEVFQFWSAHRVSLVLIAVLPLMIGLATLVVPRQVGASQGAAGEGWWYCQSLCRLTRSGALLLPCHWPSILPV